MGVIKTSDLSEVGLIKDDLYKSGTPYEKWDYKNLSIIVNCREKANNINLLVFEQPVKGPIESVNILYGRSVSGKYMISYIIEIANTALNTNDMIAKIKEL